MAAPYLRMTVAVFVILSVAKESQTIGKGNNYDKKA